MSWLSSIGIAILSAALGLVCGGLIGQLCVGWYRVTSFEGRSGYFVIASALVGAVAALVIGLVVSRFMAAESPSFLKVLGAAAGAVTIAALVVLALCRLGADPAPTMDAKDRTAEPRPDDEALRAQAFAALDADAPLERWLPYLFESPRDERTRVVLQRINERQLELAALMRSTDARLREYALQATKYPTEPAPEVIEAVLAEGRAITDVMREANDLAVDDPRFDTLLEDVSTRFRTWRDAWWGLSVRLRLDGRPPLQEIRDVAGARSHSKALNEIGLDAQAVIDALEKSAAEKKP